MGGAYLCAEAGISNAVVENQSAYIGGWLKRLRDDRRLVILAAAQAQHGADYILARDTAGWTFAALARCASADYNLPISHQRRWKP
jgi:antirestriction protein ArdC